MSSPPRNDRWPPYRGDQQRCVFVRRPGRMRPMLGYVVTWPIAGTGGRFMVSFWNEERADPGVEVRWMKRSEISPIRVDPNWLDGPAPWKDVRR